ncbi:beta-galactosidase [Lapidilactobacillus achengensis]|uniref:Beta-galactosidase n=1 Tax=Lapidilactobacillus achengensis TaxID=2486000 RepID=A0ABW1ULG1_9LACO|nr:beta-galactosidase [Lapidilactobacillus achengensis]
MTVPKAHLKLPYLLHGGDYNPDQWQAYPQIIDQDFTMMPQAGVNTVTVGVFSWAALEPEEGHYDFGWLDQVFDRVEAMNGRVILATPSGARPHWLADRYPEVLRTDEYGRQALFGGRHNHCFTAPSYREQTQQINRKLAERYGQRPSLLLWHISNEFGGECHCDLCQAAFRQWVQKKYQTLAAVNEAWWTPFWGHTLTAWDQIHSPSPIGDTNLKGLNLDWRRFVTDQTIDFYENEIQPLRELTPEIPITTNFMTDTPAMMPFHGLDYQKFATHLDVISWDSYPAWGNDQESTADLGLKVAMINDYYRSLKQQDFLIMESSPSLVNWHPFNRPKRPGVNRLAGLQNIASGSDSMLYFQWRQSRGASEMFHGAVVDHHGSTATRTFQEVSQLGADLKQLAPVRQLPHVPARVALVFDYDNMCALADSEAYADTTKQYWQTLQQHYAYFWRHDIPIDVISPQADLAPYQLVLDPMHFLMDQAWIDKVADFTQAGGTVVGTYLSGVVDERTLAYLGDQPQRLHELYGVQTTEVDTLYPHQHNGVHYGDQTYPAQDYCEVITNQTASVLATYTADFYAGQPAITKNQYGAGTAYYLAARTDAACLTALYHQLATELDLHPTYPLAKASSDISIQVRGDQNQRYLFVMNFGETANTINLTQPLTEVLSNRTYPAGAQELAPYQVLVFHELIK